MTPLKYRVARLLRRSERYTKTDMVYLASGSFWLGLGTIVSGLIGLGTAVAFANLIPKETYGTYQYVLSMMGLLAILGLPGIKTAISYASSRGNDGSYFDAIRAKIRWSFLSSIAALVIAGYYFFQGNSLLGSSFFIVAVFMPWWDVYGSYVPYLQGKKRFDMMIIYETIAQAVNAAAIIAVMWFTDDLLLLLGAFFLSWTITRFILFKRSLQLIPPNDVREPGMLSYGKHLSLMSVAGTIASNIDKLLLWQFLGPVQVAIYTFALTVPLRGASAFASINRLYFPKAANVELGTIRITLLRKTGLLFLVTASAAVVYVFIAPYLFSIFFPQYMDAVPYTQFASILVALQPFSLLATALSAHARKKALYLYNVVPSILQIVLLLALVPFYGLLGAVAAVVVTEVFQCALVVVLFLRASGHKQEALAATE